MQFHPVKSLKTPLTRTICLALCPSSTTSDNMLCLQANLPALLDLVQLLVSVWTHTYCLKRTGALNC